jgi:hypothetical protein
MVGVHVWRSLDADTSGTLGMIHEIESTTLGLHVIVNIQLEKAMHSVF